MEIRAKNHIPIWKLGAKTIFKYGNAKLALFYKENRIFVALIWGTNEKKRGHKTIITIFATKFNDL
jgi:hypothetical protein